MKTEVIKIAIGKAKNKRIKFVLLKKEDGSHFYVINTKTLVDFKTRNILKSDLCFSVETFEYLKHFFSIFSNDEQLKNMLSSELLEMNDITIKSNLQSFKK